MSTSPSLGNKAEEYNEDDEAIDDLELVLLSSIIQCLFVIVRAYADACKCLLGQHIHKERVLSRSLPIRCVRPTWENFSTRVNDTVFRKMFRMSCTCFMRLCQEVKVAVGAPVFKAENDVHSNHDLIGETPLWAIKQLGGLLPGELKIAILLRLLAGACYIDLIPLFYISETSVWNVFHDAVIWICKTFHFPLRKMLLNKDWVALKKIAAEFGEQMEQIYNGCFGSIDGIALRVKCFSTNEVPDPGNYYCRKGFYALNVQAICDRKKRFLWCSTGHKGGTHDSRAFLETQLFDILVEIAEELQKEGLYIAGDSAYALAVFLLTPYDNAAPKSIEDAFNFFHSSCRIFIECSFGELVMRWGIFWRRLAFKASKVGGVIQAAMLLHNFIVEERELSDRETDCNFFENFNYDESNRNRNAHGEVPDAIVTDNDEPKPKGRQDKRLEDLKKLGSKLRNTLATNLAAKNYVRPLQSGMH